MSLRAPRQLATEVYLMRQKWPLDRQLNILGDLNFSRDGEIQVKANPRKTTWETLRDKIPSIGVPSIRDEELNLAKGTWLRGGAVDVMRELKVWAANRPWRGKRKAVEMNTTVELKLRHMSHTTKLNEIVCARIDYILTSYPDPLYVDPVAHRRRCLRGEGHGFIFADCVTYDGDATVKQRMNTDHAMLVAIYGHVFAAASHAQNGI